MKRSVFVITNMSVSVHGVEVIHNVSLRIQSKELHVLMGPNGSGKTSLACAIMGHPDYSVAQTQKKASIAIDRIAIQDAPTEKRAINGLFLSLQTPVPIPGVNVIQLLRTAYQEINGRSMKPEKQHYNPVFGRSWNVSGILLSEFLKQIRSTASTLAIHTSLLERGIHEGFSGGERKKIELLQALILKPKFAIFDEIDTGVDVDALKLIAFGIQKLQRLGTGILLITHSQRILRYLTPHAFHVLVAGFLVKTGGEEILQRIEKDGYASFIQK